MDRLLERKATLRKLVRSMEEQITFLHQELSCVNTEIETLRAACPHTGQVYAEGRHGSDKGTLYYRCTKCGFEWDDGQMGGYNQPETKESQLTLKQMVEAARRIILDRHRQLVPGPGIDLEADSRYNDELIDIASALTESEIIRYNKILK